MTSDADLHVPAEDLAGAALGDPLTSHQQLHLDTCPTCRLELSRLLEVVTVSRDGRGRGDVDMISAPPPPAVWSAIRAAVTDTTVTPLRTPDTPADRGTGRTLSRRTLPLLLVAATVIGVLVGGGLVAAVGAWRAEPTVVAETSLAPVPGGPDGPQTGVARIEQAADGDVLSISTSDLAEPAGYYEVWLLNPATGGMIAMGVVPSGSGTATLPVPIGVDLTQYVAVDISDEPMDGDPGHSSVSVLRGELAI